MNSASTVDYATGTGAADRPSRIIPPLMARPSGNAGVHRLAMLLVALTLILILAGGNVTSKNAGLAVPDWPLSFHSVNPSGWTTNMGGTQPGVRDEHGHRLIGATVGLVVIALLASCYLTGQTTQVRRLGWVALAAVIVQGLMGGLRVTERSLALAIVHGCFAQAFFCVTIALALMTSPNWPGGTTLVGSDPGRNKALRTWTAALVVMVYGQLILGALLRHLGSNHAAVMHISGALGVGAALMLAAQHVFARPESEKPLARPMIVLILLFGCQLLLGVFTYVLVAGLMGRSSGSLLQTYVPTVHVAVGALILGVSFMMMVRTFALTCPKCAAACAQQGGSAA